MSNGLSYKSLAGKEMLAWTDFITWLHLWEFSNDDFHPRAKNRNLCSD